VLQDSLLRLVIEPMLLALVKDCAFGVTAHRAKSLASRGWLTYRMNIIGD